MNFSKKQNRSEQFQLILWDHFYADTKSRQGHHKKGKLWTNIFYEYRYNPQQNIASQIWEHIKRIIYIHHDQVELTQKLVFTSENLCNVCVYVLYAQLYLTLCDLMGVHQAPLSMGFSRQGCWNE